MDLDKYFIKFISDHKDSEMLLIQNVKFIKVPSNVCEIENIAQKQFLKNIYPDSEDYKQIYENVENIQTEIVRGIKYCNDKGEKICIGIPEEIQGILGLPFSHFNNMRKEINCNKNHIEILQKEKQKLLQEKQYLVYFYETLSIWERIKFLFGIVPNHHGE